MQVLTTTLEQFNKLNEYRTNSSQLLFVKDNNNKWIVGIEVLNDPKYAEIHNELKKLERIEYTPFLDTI